MSEESGVWRLDNGDHGPGSVVLWQDKCRNEDLFRLGIERYSESNENVFDEILHSQQPSWLFYCSFKKISFSIYIVWILFYHEFEF